MASTDIMNTLDAISDFMMSLVTTYGESCGNGMGVLLGEDMSKSACVELAHSSHMQQPHEPKTDEQDEKRAMLASIVDTKAPMCFECGAINLRPFRDGSVGCGDQDAQHTNDTAAPQIQVHSLPNTDMVFFPVPSYEAVFFHRDRDIYHAHNVYRQQLLASQQPQSEKVDNTSTRSLRSFQTSLPGTQVSSPPPEVATKWMAMGHQFSSMCQRRTPFWDRESKSSGHTTTTTTTTTSHTKWSNDGSGSYPFDEITGTRKSLVCSSTASMRPPPAPRRYPLANLGNAVSKKIIHRRGNDDGTYCEPTTSRRAFSSHRGGTDATRTTSPTTTNLHGQLGLFRGPSRPLESTSVAVAVAIMPSSSPSSSSTIAKLGGGKGGQNGAASHWKSAVDAKTGRTYYYHEVTRETQWRKPMELASDEERRSMEEKERKQKEFFSTMEANILNAVSQGVIPGTPQQGSSSGNGGFGMRRKSSRKVSLGPDGRPELVRTISSMDELVLRDLIRRQPSYRNMKPGLSKEESLRTEDLAAIQGPTRKSSGVRDGFGDSWSHSGHNLMPPLETLEESARELATENLHDSMPELFSYLPDEDPSASGSDGDDASASLRGGEDDDFSKSSLTGFGLTWEETQALKKLASITKEMIDSENDAFDLEDESSASDLKLRSSVGAMPSWKTKDGEKNKDKRNLPREIDFDDESSSGDVGSQRDQAPTFQKAAEGGSGGRALPRELDFEDSDDEEASTDLKRAPRNEAPLQSAVQSASRTVGLSRPEVKRRNTCATMYVGTTMSAPDKDATIKCICGVFRSHILSSEQDLLYSPDTDAYKVFNDHELDQMGLSSGSSKHVHVKAKAAKAVPSLDEVTKFYRDVFFKAQMEADCIIMSLIYVERLIKKTAGRLRPRANNWRSLLFSCMILSSKVWDDLSMWNVDFSQSCPPGVSFSLQRINELELAVLNALSFKVKVPASEYAKYYFLLRSMLIKSGLAGEDLGALDPLDVRGARRLQEVSSQFESMSRSKASPIDENHRSKSLDLRAIQQKTTAGLEQVVKM